MGSATLENNTFLINTCSSVIQVNSNAESSSWSFQHYCRPVLSDRLSTAAIHVNRPMVAIDRIDCSALPYRIRTHILVPGFVLDKNL